jgi:putative aldouronate transport system substrate-binding protein
LIKGKKMYLSSAAIMLLSMSVLAGCKTDTASETSSPAAATPATTTSATPATPAPSTLPEVKLTFYYPSNPPGKDQALVN